MRTRWMRARGAATVEWVVVAMVVGVGGIASWRTFERHVAATVERGGDCIVALDGTCAGTAQGAAPLETAAPLEAAGGGTGPAPTSVPLLPIGSSSLQWGAPGFTQGWTAQQRADYLRDHGVADPNANYWTPFWSSGPRPNGYTGTPDTGTRNEFAAIHDYNLATEDWPWFLTYFDVVTPLFGVTHRDLDAAVLEAWRRFRLRRAQSMR